MYVVYTVSLFMKNFDFCICLIFFLIYFCAICNKCQKLFLYLQTFEKTSCIFFGTNLLVHISIYSSHETVINIRACTNCWTAMTCYELQHFSVGIVSPISFWELVIFSLSASHSQEYYKITLEQFDGWLHRQVCKYILHIQNG